MKKLRMLALGFLAFSASLFANLSFSQGVFAAGSCNESVFLGLTPWYKNLMVEEKGQCVVRSPQNDDELEATIWTIVLNVTTLLTEVIAYIAVGMVIYGGFLYLMSAGNQQRAAKGKKTITNSVIGIIICVLASTVVATLSRFTAELSGSDVTSPEIFFTKIFNKASVWAGVICTIMMVFAGIQFALSTGNPQKAAAAKSTVVNSAIGLVIVLVASVVVNFAVGAVFGDM